MAKTVCYIDGFNLYHAIDALGKQQLKWLNLRALAESFLHEEDSLVGVLYFTAIMVWDQQKCARHKAYLSALKSVGVECVISRFQKSNKYCRTNDRYCFFHEEKQTDVALASRILCDSLKGGIERIILITADSDQVPTIAAIRGLTPNIFITVVAPPQRAQIARELNSIAHDYREISEGRLAQCLFPRNVKNSYGRTIAICPAKYHAA